MSIPDSARKVLESDRLAHLVTLNRDGSPQVTCVWIGVDGDDVVIAHLSEHRKIRNMRRDARVAVSIETEKIDAQGLQEYLVVYGTARVQEGGAAEALNGMTKSGEVPLGDNPPPGYVTRITPERYGGVGPWTSGD